MLSQQFDILTTHFLFMLADLKTDCFQSREHFQCFSFHELNY